MLSDSGAGLVLKLCQGFCKQKSNKIGGWSGKTDGNEARLRFVAEGDSARTDTGTPSVVKDGVGVTVVGSAGTVAAAI